MALTDKLRAIGDGFRSSRGTTQEYSLDEMAVLAAESGTPTDPSEMEAQWIAAIERDASNPVTKLPEGLTKIGTYAFYYRNNLTPTSLPAGVTSIGDNAFYYCTNLALTSLPSGLTSIGAYAFYGCSELALTSLPSGLTSIGGNAFRDCSELALTSLPAGLIWLKDNTFYGCSKLALTSLPANLARIDSYAFRDCTNLTEITFEGKPNGINSGAFYNCTNLLTINVPWAEGEVSGAPWGATNATINYNYVPPIDDQITWSSGYYVSGNTGELAEGSETDSSTDFVKLNGATKLLANGRILDDSGSEVIPNGRIHYYDTDKNHLSYVTNYDNAWENAVAVPDGAVYARFYTPVATSKFNVMSDTNLNGFTKLNVENFVENQIPSADGLVAADSIGYFTDVIPVTEGQSLWFASATCLFNADASGNTIDKNVVYLDANGGFVQKVTELQNSAMVHLTIPAGVTGVQFILHNNHKDYGYYKLV